MRLYEQAIHSAHSFVDSCPMGAISYERASAFYRARGFDQIADVYLHALPETATPGPGGCW